MWPEGGSPETPPRKALEALNPRPWVLTTSPEHYFLFVSLLSRDSVYDVLRRIFTHLQWWRKPSLPVVSLSLPTPPPASLQTHPLSRTHSQMWRVVLLAGQSEDKNLKESIREYKKKNLQLHRFPIEGRGQPGYHRDTTVPPLERSGDRRDGVVLLHNRCVGVCMYSQLHLAETYIYLTLSH